MKLQTFSLTLFLAAITAQPASAQKTDSIPLDVDSIVVPKKNTVFLELGGNGFLYSINYDRLFSLTNRIMLSSRIGVHFTNTFPLQYYRTVAVPFELSGLYSIYQNKHFIEVGTGITYLNNHDTAINHTENILIYSLRVGYRYQKPEGGFFFKIGFVPLYDFYVENPAPDAPHNTWFLSGGIGFGYTF